MRVLSRSKKAAAPPPGGGASSAGAGEVRAGGRRAGGVPLPASLPLSPIHLYEDGVFTGVPAGPFIYRSGKAEAMEDLARRERIDLAASYAYSDSESDLPMLRAVGNAVVVNPDDELRRIARAEGWEVLRFDRLARRLVAAGALAGLTAVGGIGSAALAARNRRSRSRRLLAPVQRGVRHQLHRYQ